MKETDLEAEEGNGINTTRNTTQESSEQIIAVGETVGEILQLLRDNPAITREGLSKKNGAFRAGCGVESR